ncbi:uncharacterized protein BXZ73DRAFT_49813 [Epithele typhae]|uniref:uncharacterized protein n=1 Tax=Epithele typhae TaxID=378194 RepID=UPI0020079A15|nr:uncharacterized protein BXZ73DRAFT_49813 [Epithele typhae]KAH9925674.1 hypothetical protein BXZ73DRAFT_49813 [Epithele typhae]
MLGYNAPGAGEVSSPKRDSELWFEDGTLELIVEDTAFRVYKGLLAHHSAVFKDMFTLPPLPAPNIGSAESRSVDGNLVQCAVVHLPDSAREWRYVLRVLIMGGARGLRERVSRPLDLKTEELLAYIRLGHKYQIEDLCQTSVKALERHINPLLLSSSLSPWDDHPPFFDATEAPVVVNLARVVGECSLLPYAMLLCSRSVYPKFTGVFSYSDGTREPLNKADEERCVQATHHLVLATISAVHSVILPPVGCTTQPLPGKVPCQQTMDGLTRTLLLAVTSPTRPLDPLMWDLLRHDSMQAAKSSLCLRCWDEVSGRVRQQRRVVWNTLPTIFGLEDISGA